MRISMLLATVAVAGSLSAAITTADAAGVKNTAGPFAVGAQYDTTHVYVDPAKVDDFVASFVGAFGGQSTKQVVVTVTPTPSTTTSQLVQTPVGTVSLFGFKTPIPYPFGQERTGYLVKDLDKAVAAARKAGANVVVAPFPDPIGRDAVVEWPGGVYMQLYWHNRAPDYPAFAAVPENRIYLSPDAEKAFVRAWLSFSGGKVVSDEKAAPGIEIGKPGETFRRLRITSGFGLMTVIVSDGHLPYPYGHETTGYAVTDLATTLANATAKGAHVVVDPFRSQDRQAAMVEFPGGYVAEVHASVGH